MKERLQVSLARAGVASRRAAERLIAEGRVTINGTIVRQQGVKVDPAEDAIKVDGRRVGRAPSSHAYWMLNKPRGYVTTLSDPEDRPTIADLLRGVGRRIFPVGRLDYHSEGLLLLTDDGALARDLMHPASKVPKVYLVKVRGNPGVDAAHRLRRGVLLDGRKTAAAEFRVTRRAANSWVEVTVHEGRKHQVRRMLEAVGHPVTKLRRLAYGGVELGSLASGRLRRLTDDEVRQLRQSIAARTPSRGEAHPS